MCNRISKTKKIVLCAAFSLFAAGAGVCAANAQKISYGGTAYAASESLQGNAFAFTPGASVRADEVKVDDVKVTGIRFEAEIGKEKYDALIDEETNGFKENCEAGMIIVPAEVLTKWESQKDAEDGKADIFEYIKWLGVDNSGRQLSPARRSEYQRKQLSLRLSGCGVPENGRRNRLRRIFHAAFFGLRGKRGNAERSGNRE